MIYYTGLVGKPWQIQCIYLYNGTHINKRRRKEKEKRERFRKCGAVPLGLCFVKTSTIVKTEGCRIVCQGVDKAVNDDVAWSCGGVMEVVLHDDIFMCLHIHLTTQTAEGVLSQSLDDLGITRGECLGRTQWSSLLDLATYLYYFTSGCVPIII